MPSRDAAEFNEASYRPDVSAEIDSLEDHVRELLVQESKGRLEGRQLDGAAILVNGVVRRLLDEGRLGALADVKRLPARELLAKLMAEVIDAPDARLMARCIDYVFELGVQQGLSQTEIGALSEVGKATASRYCVLLKETYLDGQPARGMKSKAAVESYRQLRTGRSSRGPRQEWKFAAMFHAALAMPA